MMENLQERKARLKAEMVLRCRMRDLLDSEIASLDKEITACNKDLYETKRVANNTVFTSYEAKDVYVQVFMRQEYEYVHTYRTSENDVFSCNSAVFKPIFKPSMGTATTFYPRCRRIKAVEHTGGTKGVCINSIPLRAGDYMCIGENGYVFACPKQVFEVLYVAER